MNMYLFKKKCCLKVSSLILLLYTASIFAQQDDLIAFWNFDDVQNRIITEKISSQKDTIKGNFKIVDGFSHKAIKFDGFTTCITLSAEQAPKIDGAFTIEAWVALYAYPWSWCPVAAQTDNEKAVFYFGIDSRGCFGLQLAVDGNWITCRSQAAPESKVGLSLATWHHIAAVFDPNSGIKLYQDFKLASELPLKGSAILARNEEFWIGRNKTPKTPDFPVREWATYPSNYSLDGIIDELKIHNRALSEKDIANTYTALGPVGKPPVESRKFPVIENPSGTFGAFYTQLKYYDEWDSLWPVSEYSDVVVLFDKLPIKVAFWRGTRYSPCWVSENGKWMADQSRELGGNWNLKEGPREKLPTGCMEHMSNAQCRSSHVRIIENTDARVVIHWRYALLDVLYRQYVVDPLTGWGAYGDEYYTIYPDGVAVRSLLPGRGGWQETIFLNEPGTKPEDNCELGAITLANLKGESRTFSWENGYPKFNLIEPLIQMTNLKSKYRPFMIFRPGSRMRVFNVEVRPEYSHFPWWNHWPVAQIISDGRHAQAPDMASHSSLVWGSPVDNAALYGMTEKPAASLVNLAKSWIKAPELKITGKGFTNDGYDFHQRAYILSCHTQGSNLNCSLNASADSPVVNPAFVINNWGEQKPQLKINGKRIKQGADFRFGFRRTLTGTDLIVWIKVETIKPLKISLLPERK